MSYQQQARPENARERALELLEIKQPNAALKLLHEVLSSRRHKTWSPVHEGIMKLYVDICVDLRVSREMKDGLHQYRNLCQSQAPNSLEKVLLHLLEKTENLPCKDEGGSGEGKYDDLDDPTAPLKQTLKPPVASYTVNIKFVMEVHRAIMDILRSHSKLAHVYHKAAITGLTFLADLNRKSDFKRLCEYVRSHVNNLQRYGKSDSKMRNWDGWSSDALAIIMQTKLVILKLCQKLKIPSEMYRTLEDFQSLRKMGNKLQFNMSGIAKGYFSILLSVCLVNGDFYLVGLLAAKLLDIELEAGTDGEEIMRLANTVTLATICSPAAPTARQIKLIHLINNLSRIDLVDEIGQKYIQYCEPNVKSIFDSFYESNGMYLLQGDLSGLLDGVKDAKIVSFDGADQPDLQVPLRTTLLSAHLKMLSKYYSVVKISSLVSKFENIIGRATLEKIMVGTGRVDWRNDALRFQPPNNTKWIINLTKSLSKVHAEPVAADDVAFFDQIKSSLAEENLAAVARKSIIEKEKEDAERKQMEISMQGARKKAEEDAKRKQEEKHRLVIEEKKRELEKQKKIHQELEEIEKKKFIEALGQSAEESKDMSVEELQRKHQAKLAKKKAAQEKSISLRLKKLDYTVRAIRDEEVHIIKERLESKLMQHKQNNEKGVLQKAKENKEMWETSIEQKNKLSALKVFRFTKDLESKVMTHRQERYEAVKTQCDKEAADQAKAAKIKRAKRRQEIAIEEEREAERLAEQESLRLAKEKELAAKKEREEEARRKEEERMQAMEEKKLAESRSNTRYVPPSRRNRESSGGGNRFADRGVGDRYGGGDRFAGSRNSFGGDRERERPTNSRWR
mmetsp:Transcript_22119/g.33189  ORF Transcript_22119/g.33189 Transcript_22119/m.33189 type:complete len:848 (-) Transcript_22119:241-2784(-)